MKSSAPWSVKGIERDARETAKEAAKREGMTVGEWLNQMIYSAGDPTPSDGNIEGLKLRDLVTAIEHLHKRVAQADQKSADAVTDLTRNMGGAVERIQRLERVKPAEGTYEDLSARLGKLEASSGDRQRVDALKALEKAVAQVAVQFNNAHKTSLERLDSTERQLQDLAERIDQIGGGNEDASGVTFLKDAVDGLSTRIARAERIASEAAKLKESANTAHDPDFVERTGNRLRVLGDEIKRGGDQINSLEAVIGKLSQQIEAAEKRSSEGVQKVAETIAELREQFSGDNNDDNGRDANRAEIEAAIAVARQETDERITALQSSFNEMIDRLQSLEPAAREQSAAADTQEEPDETITPLAFDITEEAEEEPATVAAEEKATTSSENEEEEDPFAFADEIDEPAGASGESGPSQSRQDHEFSFDLDEEENESPANEAQALLSEVQEVFGKKQGSEDQPDTAKADDPADEIDNLLADLDELSNEGVSPAEAPGERREESDAADAAPIESESPVEDLPPEDENPQNPEDFLKAARRKAKEAAERAAEDEKPKRRKLTAKQKAILAARARQKRKLAAQENQSELQAKTAPSKKSAIDLVDKAPADAFTIEIDDDEDEDQKGLIAKLTGGIGSMFKRSGDNDDEEEPTSRREDGTNEDSEGANAAFSTLKSTAAAKPVTLALGVAIFLAIAALFFLVKDIVLKPGAPVTRPAAETIRPQPETTTPQTAESAPEDSNPVVPEAPAIDPKALYLESVAALNAAETDEATAAAIAKLQEAAALGHPPAQLQLGELYKTGQGVEQDLGQARTWFRRSANGGNVLAMHRIGVMTARGDGGPADSNEAIAWFEMAANRGLVDSQYNLGAIFHPSEGAASTIQDAGKAYYWYSLAAKNGDDQAAPLAAGVAAALTPAQQQEIDARVEAWSAEPSDITANELAPLE